MGKRIDMMAQQSVTTETLRSKIQKSTILNQWMRLFFSEDTSPSNRPIVELQQRAVWIALALILQALNEAVEAVAPIGTLLPFIFIAASFYAMWRAIRPTPPHTQAHYTRKQPARWQKVVLIVTVALMIPGAVLLGRGLALSLLPPQFSNDGT